MMAASLNGREIAMEERLPADATPTEPGWYATAYGEERWFNGSELTDYTRSPLPAWATAPKPPALNRPLPGASFADATARFFQRWNQMAGRSSRSEFWWAILALTLANVVLNFIPVVGQVLAVVVNIGTLIPLVTVTMRRYHDTNRSGWWIILPIMAQLAGFIAAAMAFLGVLVSFGEDQSARDDGMVLLTIAGVAALITLALTAWACMQLAGKSVAEGTRFDRS